MRAYVLGVIPIGRVCDDAPRSVPVRDQSRTTLCFNTVWWYFVCDPSLYLIRYAVDALYRRRKQVPILSVFANFSSREGEELVFPHRPDRPDSNIAAGAVGWNLYSVLSAG